MCVHSETPSPLSEVDPKHLVPMAWLHSAIVSFSKSLRAIDSWPDYTVQY
jgi:hypothetical protein